jgi:hypothetical protein
MPTRLTVRGAQGELGSVFEPQFCCALQFWSWILNVSAPPPFALKLAL